jgi:hypothetical protein
MGEGWEVETQHGNYAVCTVRRPVYTEIEVEVDDTNVRVDCEMGSGYQRERTTAVIPIDVLAQLLEGAGLEVKRSPQAKDKEE